jgi:hypothetical protein
MPEDTNGLEKALEKLRTMTPEDFERVRSDIEKKCKEEGKHNLVPIYDINQQLDSRAGDFYSRLTITEVCPNCSMLYSRQATREEIEKYNDYIRRFREMLKEPMTI